MNEMFDRYPQPEDYIPDNRPRPHCFKPLEIMSGETVSHSFEIPFDVKTDTKDYDVIYKLGIKDIIIKTKDELEVTDFDDRVSIITCKLSPIETQQFFNTSLDCHVQIKFKMLDDSISYSEIYKVFLRNSLEVFDGEKPGPEGLIGGLAYTED